MARQKVDINTIKMDYASDANPIARDAALDNLYSEQSEQQPRKKIDINLIQLDNIPPKTTLGALPQTPANNAYGINPLSPEQSAIGAARMYGDIQTPNYLERVSNDISQTGQDTAGILRNIGNQNPASSALQLVGQGAKLASAPIAQAMQPVTTALAPAAQSVANAVDNTSIGQMIGDKLLQGKEAVSSFSQANPELSADIGAIANIASTLTGGKVGTASTNALGKGLEATGSVIEKSGAKSSMARKAAIATDLYTPKITANVAKERASSTITSKLNQTPEYIPSPFEADAIKVLQELPIKKSNTLQTNYNIVDNAVKSEARNLKSILDKTPVKYKADYFTTKLDDSLTQLKTDPLIIGDGEIVANRIYNKMRELASSNPNTPSGLLQTRKQFDAWARSKKGSVFDANDTAFSTAVKNARNTVNDAIAEIAPNAEVKASLLKQSQLIGALDNIETKIPSAPKTRASMVGGKISSMIPESTLGRVGIASGLGGLGLISGALPVAATGAGMGLAGLAAYKGITSPLLRQGLGESTKFIGEALQGNVPTALQNLSKRFNP